MQSPALFPQGAYPANPSNPAYPATPAVIPSFGGVTEKMQRLLDELRVDYVYVAPLGDKKFGVQDLDLSASFAFPFLYNDKTPIYVTPGFTFHWWDGPKSTNSPPTGLFDSLPPRVYDAYLDTAWNPQATPWLGGELAFRIGVYSDFSKVTAESLRYTGRGLAVLTFSPAVQVKAGIFYLDRIRVKILPAGGIVWTPSSDVRFDILFPNPKIARRLSTIGNTEWWLYARGEYGGGSWTIQTPGGVRPDRLQRHSIRRGAGVQPQRGHRRPDRDRHGVRPRVAAAQHARHVHPQHHAVFPSRFGLLMHRLRFLPSMVLAAMALAAILARRRWATRSFVCRRSCRPGSPTRAC